MQSRIENLNIAYRLLANNVKPLGDRQLSVLKTVEKGHGRIEMRKYYYSMDIGWMLDAKKEWSGLTGVGMVERETETAGKKSKEISYYIGSITSVKEFEKSVRNHWKIESMHWSLDVTYGDDANRTRKGAAPQNMAVLKRIAFNTVKNDQTKHPDTSMKGRRFLAGIDFAYRDYLVNLNFKNR